MLKKLTAIALSFVVFMGMSVSAYAAQVRFQIGSPVHYTDGIPRSIVDGVEPFIEGGRTMLPLHTVAEVMGAELGWDPETRTATLTRGDDVVTLVIGEELPGNMGTPLIRDGRTFVPVAFVAEELGAETSWVADTRTVYITGLAPAQATPPVAMLPSPDAGESLYEKFNAANEALMEAGSFRMVSESVMVMDVAYGEEVMTVEIASAMIIDQVIRSETDIDMRMEMISEAEGETITSVSYFRDGVLYMELLGEWSRMEIPIAEMIEQVGVVTFPEEAITSEVMEETEDGYVLGFTIDSEAMTELMATMLGALGAMGFEAEIGLDIEISDIEMVAFLDADGALTSMVMVMGMSVEAEGVAISLVMEMVSEITQVGDVEVEFPAELDEL